MRTQTLACTYGSNKTPDTVLIYDNGDFSKWYVVQGGETVNLTFDDLEEGVNVEEIEDIDCFTWSGPINTLEELINAVEN